MPTNQKARKPTENPNWVHQHKLVSPSLENKMKSAKELERERIESGEWKWKTVTGEMGIKSLRLVHVGKPTKKKK